ncbi:hypothetical protein ACRAWG_35245 [Methylobacterium sp. P31]
MIIAEGARVDTVPTPPTPAKIDKAALLGSFHSYLGGRIDTIGRRSALLMAFLASFLGVATSPVLKGVDPASSTKVMFALSHPSIPVGIVGMVVLLWSELARVRTADDLFTRIAFTDVELGALQDQYVEAHVDALFRDSIVNMRVVGNFLRAKIKLYNAGCVLFVVSVSLYALGL